MMAHCSPAPQYLRECRVTPRPSGVFSVIGKELWHRSNIYSAAPMPYMQRITWSGIALHAGVLPGHPASHGCIRLAKDFAVRLWHLTKRGTRVIIAANNVDPVQLASLRLFSKPKTASSSQEFPTETPAGKEAAINPFNSYCVSAKRSATRSALAFCLPPE